MDHTNDIIKFILRNRVSTTEVADALGKSGTLSHLVPMSHDMFKVGKARCVFTANNSNFSVHEQLREVKEGEIVIVFAHNCEGRAILGDLVSKFVILYKGAEAFVINGLVRDASRIRREHYPVWAYGSSPLGCFNVKADPYPKELEREVRKKVEGGVAVCDDGGVVVIPKDKINSNILDNLNKIELQEDIWYFCLNTLKWDTKKIVCDKDYLKQKELLPDVYRSKLKEFDVPLDGKG